MKANQHDLINTPCDLMTTVQAAEYLRVSPKTLEKMRLEGGGPAFYKIGRTVRYALDDLNNYLEQNKFLSTSEYCMKKFGN